MHRWLVVALVHYALEGLLRTWQSTSVLVTGGASFIGSHLTAALVKLGARVRVVDNLVSGRLANLRPLVDSGDVEFVEGDLRHLSVARDAVRGIDSVFHLAAEHGGRGFIDREQSVCATNCLLDGAVVVAASEAGVGRFVLASSACVYPVTAQDASATTPLHEDVVGPPYDPDGMYGWAKLTAERMLAAFRVQRNLPCAICRYFTVYGPRGGESHALHAMIARAYVGSPGTELEFAL